MGNSVNLLVLAFMLVLNGCAIADAAGGSIDLTETRKIVIYPHHIEISGDIDVRDWEHIAPLHKLVK